MLVQDLYGYGSNRNRKYLRNSKDQYFFTQNHIHSLLQLQELCHLSSIPFIVIRLDDILDCVVGDLCQRVVSCKKVDVSMNEEIPVIFHSLQESYIDTKYTSIQEDKEFSLSMTNCIILSNIFNILHLIELSLCSYHSLYPASLSNEVISTIDSMLGNERDSVLQSLTIIKNQLKMHPYHEDTQVHLTIPLFVKYSQILLSKVPFCEKLPMFVDYFIIKLFEYSNELNTSEEYDILLQSITHTLSYLLTVTLTWSSYECSGDCTIVRSCNSYHCIVRTTLYEK